MHGLQLREHLVRSGEAQPSMGAVEAVLLGEPFDDPDPDPGLSMNIDHYLYGAAKRRQQ
jgi:hypothetical protein